MAIDLSVSYFHKNIGTVKDQSVRFIVSSPLPRLNSARYIVGTKQIFVK